MDHSNLDRIWTLHTRKLAGEATAPELEELEFLLQSHPDLEPMLQSVEAFWKTRHEPDPDYMEATYLLHLERMKTKGFDLSKPSQKSSTVIIPLRQKIRRILFDRNFLFILALALLSIPIYLYTIDSEKKVIVANKPEKQFNSEVSTKNGSRTRIVLPDGSVVFLNAGSKLNYDKNFGNPLREVKLTGEGFFDVVPNPDKPFKIYTESVEIKVLGTAFNVKSYPGDKTTETSLIRGTVQVVVNNRPNERFILKPNEKLVVQNEPKMVDPVQTLPARREPVVAIRNLSYLRGVATAVETQWTENRLSFQDETFAEISAKMMRWYDVSFEFRNHNREATRFTGSFKDETLQQALEAMKYSSAFRFEIRNKVVTIY